jgi:tRNA nucleotidyltransferase/poly(A) polymerase
MRKTFLEFVGLKENTDAKKASSEVKLADDTDFKPFVIDGENHPNLRVIAKAFLDSDKVSLPGPDGYPQKLTTIDPAKGETSPRLKKKGLYLVGGAVRDHLLGKTPRDYNLVTDAGPDEIRLILRSAGFTEVKPQSDGKSQTTKYDKHPDAGQKNKVFHAKGWDRGGKEYIFNARVNGEEFEIATFRKGSKGSGDGKTPDNMEFGTLDDDAGRRDFTVNAMYIPLTSADGANAKLVDPHGGAHHLRRGEIEFVGNPKERLGEDQGRVLRYVRQVASHGKNTKIGDDVKSAIKDIKDLPSISREKIKEEFLKGLQHPDTDPVQYVKMYKEMGLLDTVFPDMTFKLDSAEDFSDKKEKRLAIAWLLRANPPAKVEKMLHQGTWSDDEVRDIVTLIEFSKWMSEHGKNPKLFLDKFFDMKKNFHKTGMVPSLIKQWGGMNKQPEDVLHHFLNHELDTKGFVADEKGKKSINPLIAKLFGGRTPQGSEFSDAIKWLETDKFRKRLETKDEALSSGEEDHDHDDHDEEDHHDDDTEE